ncbi:U3 snoRNP-associated protein-like protein Utp11 [Lophiostoma macrostomum CBS 122681]|uniref:U3 small nucleolar RNA-associated protein 11 n=1 Tax=Lophiostoma macrostomum CBS 122681 TaxID=1314788 RepID=A0A6A6TSU7_9PLEO|nr:U3 snoRNP-associated protein-like protein Utp11 [Lophiostoma macrostomum CBS 122681]
MSSMRNAVQRRNHKERAQPLEREKWGLLEKRKDYKLRAADHKEKKKRLRILKQKASGRNPDEFSFAMMSSKVDSKGRKITERGNTSLSQGVVKLLKTQDIGYIRTMLQMVRKERKEFEQCIIVEEEGVQAIKDGERERRLDHTIFVDDEREQRKFRPGKSKKDAAATTESFEDEEIEGQPRKASKKQQEALLRAEQEQRALLRKRERAHEKAISQLEGIKARERDLMIVEDELEKQRAKMNNTIGGTNKNGVKFKIRERKK